MEGQTKPWSYRPLAMLLTGAAVLALPAACVAQDLVMTGVVDGPLSGGVPKAVELRVVRDIADLSAYGLGSANNGGGSDGQELTFSAVSAQAGDYLYVATEAAGFAAFFGFAPDYTSNAVNINGDDALELFMNGAVVDVFGDVSSSGAGQPWQYTDGWAKRVAGGPDGDVFTLENWSFSGANALDGETSNGTSEVPFPLGSGGPRIEDPPDPDPPGPVGASCSGGEHTRISALQGAGSESPHVGEVHTIEGVVVGDFQGPARLSGFFVQEQDADQDGDPSTSEGIFVYQGGFFAEVDVGDLVAVRGTVTEFNGLTELTGVTHIERCGTGASVTPAALSLPLTSPAELEAVEGMEVVFAERLVVTETFDMYEFGEVSLATHVLRTPTQVALPGPAAAALGDLNDRSRIVVDDGFDSDRYNDCTDDVADTYLSGAFLSEAPPTLRLGDEITGLRGVVHYAFGSYKVLPGTDPVCTPGFFSRGAGSARPESAPAVGGRLTVASFNVLNYFLTLDDGQNDARGADSAVELERQASKLVSALTELDAAVVGLVELENSSADAPIADLAARAGYDYLPTGLIGSDAIAVGFLYDGARVTPVGAPAILDSSVDPDFASDLNRPALLATFEELESGERFNVVVNHFKSKGSSCEAVGDPDTGDGQGNCNLTRTAAAQALAKWLQTDPTGQGDPDYLILGDLNAYAMEDPVRVLLEQGYSDLVAERGNDADSYVFFGQSGRLDHALASASLATQVTGAAVWQINAQEPRILDYNDAVEDPGENYPVPDDPNPVGLFAVDPFRSSDHNPVVVGLELRSDAPCLRRRRPRPRRSGKRRLRTLLDSLRRLAHICHSTQQ